MEHSLDIDVAEPLVEVHREVEFASRLWLLCRAHNDVLEALLKEASTCVVSFPLDWCTHDHIVLVEGLEMEGAVMRTSIFIVEPEHGHVAVFQLLRERVFRILVRIILVDQRQPPTSLLHREH